MGVAGRVLVRQEVTTVEADEGTEVWVEDGPYVAGMVAGGYWSVVQRAETPGARNVRSSRRAAAPAGGGEEVDEDGVDPAGPEGSDG